MSEIITTVQLDKHSEISDAFFDTAMELAEKFGGSTGMTTSTNCVSISIRAPSKEKAESYVEAVRANFPDIKISAAYDSPENFIKYPGISAVPAAYGYDPG